MRPSAFRAIREKKILAAICFGILCVMIVAAFWPFEFHPSNHVTWLSDENGLRFGGNGVVLSQKSFEFTDCQSPAGASLELWLEPFQEKYSTALLSFSFSENPGRFRLRQSQNSLLILQEPLPTLYHSAMTSLWVPYLFQAGRRSFIVISSGPQGTVVYLNGIAAEKSPTFKMTQKDFSGRLIIGSSPVAYDTWRGKLMGLSLFCHEVTPAEVSEHYQAWLTAKPESIKNDQPAALYAFSERGGSLVRNQVLSNPDLTIPRSFGIPYKPFLKAAWKEFYPNSVYLRDIFINIAGFVPLGFFFCIYFSCSQTIQKAVVAAIILGAAFSLTIEVLQWFIPMRDSGTTDIVTNTLGTAIGASLCRWAILHPLFGKPESQAAG